MHLISENTSFKQSKQSWVHWLAWGDRIAAPSRSPGFVVEAELLQPEILGKPSRWSMLYVNVRPALGVGFKGARKPVTNQPLTNSLTNYSTWFGSAEESQTTRLFFEAPLRLNKRRFFAAGTFFQPQSVI